MPPADSPALGALAVPYNLVSWSGGQYEFVSCDLSRRAPEYAGTCQDKTVACTVSAIEGRPYSCVELDCAALCDCGTVGCAAGQVCAKGGGWCRGLGCCCLVSVPCSPVQNLNQMRSSRNGLSTASLQVCSCPACRALQTDAATDGEFTTIAAAAAGSGATAALFAPINAAAASGIGRRLLAASNDEVRRQGQGQGLS